MTTRTSVAERTLQAQIERIKRDIHEHRREIDLREAIAEELEKQVSCLDLQRAQLAIDRGNKAKP